MSTSTAGAFPSSRPPHSHRARVLYVEDSPQLRDLMHLILRLENHDLETACNGQEALQRLSGNPGEFDLLITDHHMPVMNGLELVRRLHAAAYPRPIIVFSSELDPAVHDHYLKLGVQVLLPKPIRLAELRQALRQLLAPHP